VSNQFITLLGGAAAAWPLAARAQQAPVIGLLGSEIDPHLAAFHKGLAESGYVEGRNASVEYRWAEGRLERYPVFAADLVRRRVAVIAAVGGIPAVTAARAATAAIPIVFQGGFDPVESGFVPSLAKPGGNLTGITNLALELGPKRLEVMRELLPGAKVFALLVNPDHPNVEAQSRDMRVAARLLGVELRSIHARTLSDFDAAFASVSPLGASGLIVGVGQPFTGHTRELGQLAVRHSLPTIHESREFVAAGGLASYTGDRAEAFRLVGLYVGRILKGEKPADLPVQQSTKVELLWNLRTAKALGLEVPRLLARADEVIEWRRRQFIALLGGATAASSMQ
jgi:putative tryptophan/tyrosine transport system substrate-binding protein